MAYYLAVREKEEYKLLDVSSLEEFQRISKFSGNRYSLEEIDNFTSKFDCEFSFKRKLYDRHIITADDITKEITIRRKNKNELEKITYDLVYKNVIKYLDIVYLKNKLLSLQDDKEFLNKLITFYRNSHSNQESIAQIRYLLLGNTARDINMYSALELFFESEIYTINYKTKKQKTKYKSLHDLAMFIHHYVSLNKRSEVEIVSQKFGRKQGLESLKKALLDIKASQVVSLPKKKFRIKEEVDGQISLFD